MGNRTHHLKGIRQRYMRAAFLVLGTAALFSAPALADFPSLGIEKGARRVMSDDELGEMRGKFIAPESVNFFGIQLMTAWQTGDGVVMSAALSFGSGVDRDANNNIPDGSFTDPKVMAAWMHGCDGCGNPALDIPGPGGTPATQLAAINGAVQITKVAGDDNLVTNVMNVSISPTAGETFTLGDTGTEINKSEAVTFVNGDVVNFKFEMNAIGMILNRQSQGSSLVMQGFFGNQLTQNVDLVGNANSIANSFDIVIGVDPNAVIPLMAQNALTSMQGWGF